MKNGNSINLEEFDELKKNTEAEYKKIGSIYCPALKSDVVFNSEGWHHLRYNLNLSERDKKVQRNKFHHFSNAVGVLSKVTTIQEYRRLICPIGKTDKNGFRKTKLVECFGFLAIINFAKGVRINVVVRRKGGDNGQFSFWSVMPYWRLSNNV